MTSRYCYCPMTFRKLGRRVTLMCRIRRRLAWKKKQPDLYPVTGYFAPVYPGK